jgi:hypothetical protein
MKRCVALLTALALASCVVEPPKTGQMEAAIQGLSDLHKWDPVEQGKGFPAYDAVVGSGPDILHLLVEHLTDEKPTAIYDRLLDLKPNVGDVCLLILLRMTGLKWQEFLQDGLFISTQLDNPLLCIRWDRAARTKVQARFRQILPPPQ